MDVNGRAVGHARKVRRAFGTERLREAVPAGLRRSAAQLPRVKGFTGRVHPRGKMAQLAPNTRLFLIREAVRYLAERMSRHTLHHEVIKAVTVLHCAVRRQTRRGHAKRVRARKAEALHRIVFARGKTGFRRRKNFHNVRTHAKHRVCTRRTVRQIGKRQAVP